MTKAQRNLTKSRGKKPAPTLSGPQFVDIEEEKKKAKRSTVTGKFEANESRKACTHCGSTRNRIYHTRSSRVVTSRYRRCLDCGGNWSSTVRKT